MRVSAVLVMAAALLGAAPEWSSRAVESGHARAAQTLKEGRRALDAARAAAGIARLRLLDEHMTLMQQANETLQMARPASDTPVTLVQAWVREHTALSDQVVQQLLESQRLMMRSARPYIREEPRSPLVRL